MKKLVLAVALVLGATTFAQEGAKAAKVNQASDVKKTEVGASDVDLAKLKAEKAAKEAEIAKLQGEVSAIKNKIFTLPGWKFGGMGTIGANFAGFNDWYSNAIKNSSTGNIGVAINGYANLDREKYFWRNTGMLNLGWTKIDNKDISTDNTDFQATTDVLNINSLFGYKLTKTLATSAMAEYRTSVIENFNNPGYLDLGVGATWTPMPELVVVVHPLNYNFVFSDSGNDYQSSLGCKVMAEYNKDFGLLKYRSNVSAFLSYEDLENLSNWTWINSLGFNIWKGIGVGLEAGLRQNKQEAFANQSPAGTYAKLEDSNNPLQSYWLVGLSYGF